MKHGETPTQGLKQPHRLAQTDIDTRCTKKNSLSFYGHKDHVKVGAKTKLIHSFAVTPASTNDRPSMPGLMTWSDGAVHADLACTGEKMAADLEEKEAYHYIHETGSQAGRLDRSATASQSATRPPPGLGVNAPSHS